MSARRTSTRAILESGERPRLGISIHKKPPPIPELIEHEGLLQRDFAHELRANDLANIKAFHLQRLSTGLC